MSEHQHDDHHELGELPDADTAALLAVPEFRIDGPPKVTGEARYAGDKSMPGMLWAAFLGSPVPLGRIRAVDTSKAGSMPGVRAVITGANTGRARFGRRLLDQPVLCWDLVRFVGDRVAAVAADTLEQAEAALGAIELDIEELTPNFDLETALTADAAVLHPAEEAATYQYLGGTRSEVPHPNMQGRVGKKRGEPDIEAVFARAPHVFEHTFTTARTHAGYMEPHATLVWIDADGRVHVVSTNKTPLSLRQQMATSLGMKPAEIVVEADYIGGDFGGKGYCVDEYGCYFLAKATGRPVKAVSRYADELAITNVRHASVIRLRSAVDDDGRLVAHDAFVLMDGGAYAAAKPLPALALAGGVAVISAYRVPNVRIEHQVVYTNTVPGGHVRAPGEVQAIFAGESHLDAIARELGMDPLEFRLRNVVRDGERGALGDNFREVKGAELLEAAAKAIDWERPRPANHGLGLSLGVRHVGGGAMSVAMRLHHDGRIELITGLIEHGGGEWQVLRRVFALSAGVDESRVTITKRTTADQPPDQGVGGSRVTNIGGRAAQELGHELREWLEERLPRAVPNAPEGARLRRDALVDPESGDRLAGFEELAAALVPENEPLELTASHDAGTHGPDDPSDNNFAAYAIEVAVDPDTGSVRIEDAVIAVDVGTVINPVAHAGQIDGGFAFGVGAALIEELVVEDGIVVGRSLADSLLPTIRDVPPLRHVIVPTTLGPGGFGAKMAGEVSNAPAAPAIANAVADAVGVRMTHLPMTPERVLEAIRQGG
jgi:CO/xanthine dehydrogenase Mo-binding subunit